jgi:alpha-L-fucosidase
MFEQAIKNIDKVIAAGPFEANWDSLKGFKVPEWYIDGKFGIFIHWGVYSVPAFGSEWYPRQMYLKDAPEFEHHVKTWGPQDKFGYKDFIPMFRAQKWDPQHWAELFKRSGARYVVPVAEHHDGFAMYDCPFHEWTSVKMGPHRDIVGELSAAVRSQGLVAGLSSHREEHWWFFDGGMTFPSDVQDPKYRSLYGFAAEKDSPPSEEFLDEWLVYTCDLVDRYKPLLVWFDWWIKTPEFQPYLQKFAAYYYNRGAQWGQQVAINFKEGSYPLEAGVFDMERAQSKDARELFWQTDTSVIKNSWGYVENRDYKTAGSIIGDLVDIVSKNGSLLLNIGPRPDGTIPEEEERILLEIGQWLDVNGEAIYGTRPWKTCAEGPTEILEGFGSDVKRAAFTPEDIRFTSKDSAIYAFLLACPTDGVARIKSLAGTAITKVEMLGTPGELKWEQTAEGLTVHLPSTTPAMHTVALRLITM